MTGPAPTRVLFVCIGNTCRSQMAEALARHLAPEVIDPQSAGLSPFGRIVPDTLAVLRERGISARSQFSKGLREVDPDHAALIVNMTGMPGGSLFPGARVVDWEIDDPYGQGLDAYRRTLEAIEELLRKLIAELRGQAAAGEPEPGPRP